jgi:glutathione synthase/RimK-type ligase-like ATP-grasp enzyme
LSEELSSLAERCARAFKAPVAGVDICEDENGFFHVIELNVTPAFTSPHMPSVGKVVDMIVETLAE